MIKSFLFLHILFVSVWIGGMVFTLLFLRPALESLSNKEDKVVFLQRLYNRFFLAVWLSILVLFFTGMYLWHGYRRDFSENTLFHLKLFLFLLMVLNFSYIYFFLFKRGKFNLIPNLVWLNLIFGVLILITITYIS